MTLKLHSPKVNELREYRAKKEKGLDNAFLNISFNENEIKRLSEELEKVKFEYAADRSEKNKKAMKEIEQKIEDAKKEIELDKEFIENSKNKIELSLEELDEIAKDIRVFMEPIYKQRAEIERKIDELQSFINEYSFELSEYGKEILDAISVIDSTCGMDKGRKLEYRFHNGNLNEFKSRLYNTVDLCESVRI